MTTPRHTTRMITQCVYVLLLLFLIDVRATNPQHRGQLQDSPPPSQQGSPSSSPTLPVTGQGRDQCARTNAGNMPRLGACHGPTERAVVRLDSVEKEVGEKVCGQDKVAFYREGVRTGLDNILCGECVPGRAGIDDPLRSCGLNEYCNDDGLCTPLKDHPLLHAPCPYDSGLPFYAAPQAGWCGPGLLCIQHVCMICLEGVKDPRNGRVCVGGKWSMSEWDRLFSSPPSTFLLVICVAVVVRLTIGTCLGRILDDKPLWCNKAWRRRNGFYSRTDLSDIELDGRQVGGGDPYAINFGSGGTSGSTRRTSLQSIAMQEVEREGSSGAVYTS